MGVQHLWSIIHCSGKDIDLSALKGKVIAIDMSIWLNQAFKSNNDLVNPHLHLLYKRICKLLYFKIKPVFVFDGPVPSLKRHAIEQRRRAKQLKIVKTDKLRKSIMSMILKKKAFNSKPRQNKRKTEDLDDIFKIESNINEEPDDNMFDDDNDFVVMANDYIRNFKLIDEIDIHSDSFNALPLEVQHQVIKFLSLEKRYGYESINSSIQNKKVEDFSKFQIQRLLERSKLQKKMENLQENMNNKTKESLLQNSNNPQINKLFSVSGVTAKKVLSHTDGYLFLIDKKDLNVFDDKSDISESNYGNIKSTEESKISSSLNEMEMDSILKSANKLKKSIKSNGENSRMVLEDDFNEAYIKEKNDNQSKIVIENNFEIKDISEDNDKISTDLNRMDNVCFENESKFELATKLNQGIDSKTSNYEDENKFEIKDANENNVKTSTNLNRMDNVCFENENNFELATKLNQGIDSKTSNYEDLSECNVKENKNYDKVEEEEEDDDDDDFIEVVDEENEILTEDFINKEKVEPKNTFILEGKKLDENPSVSNEELNQIMYNYNEWEKAMDYNINELEREEHKMDKQATTMNEQYIEEAKNLLKLFGLPYIESLGEAEAQCAYLEQIGLTNGTITEDSDIWLFGGCNVYKHAFHKEINVRHYNRNSIFKKLGLNRDLMICIGMLSGCDYTPGVYGIGPVISMEIIAEFSSTKSIQSEIEVLESFKSWYDKYKNCPDKCLNEQRKKYLRFEIKNNFPDKTIFNAYYNPIVDTSKENFKWSIPKSEKLIDFAEQYLGWKRLKAEETMKQIQTSEDIIDNQKKITDYFNNNSVSPSKRLKLATSHRNFIVKKNNKRTKNNTN